IDGELQAAAGVAGSQGSGANFAREVGVEGEAVEQRLPQPGLIRPVPWPADRVKVVGVVHGEQVETAPSVDQVAGIQVDRSPAADADRRLPAGPIREGDLARPAIT